MTVVVRYFSSEQHHTEKRVRVVCDLQHDTRTHLHLHVRRLRHECTLSSTYGEESSESFEVLEEVVDGVGDDEHGFEDGGDESQEFDEDEHIYDANQIPQHHRTRARKLRVFKTCVTSSEYFI